MRCESTAASPGGKRGRDPEEEVYLDNFHSHKRYLSEVMASSLNGLTVVDSIAENLMESPSRFENIISHRDEFALQYSPMSEDSDDARCFENTPISDAPTSPVSPHRHPRLLMVPVPAATCPLPSCSLASVVACSHPRHRGSETEGRFPSSPTDVCHAADLRRAALMRSVQIRTQGEDRPFSCNKTGEDGGGYPSPGREAEDYVELCSSADGRNKSKLADE